MAVSYSTITPTNLELTPMRVTYKGVDLGATLDNVVLGIETMKAEIKADQLGDTVIDRRVSGHKFTVTTSLAEAKFKDNWKAVFPNMNLVTSGGSKIGYFDSQVGRSDIDDAGELVLHPLSLPDADKSGDYLFYKATADANSELTYGPNDQLRLKLVMNVYPDFSVSPVRFMLHGDPTVGLTSASAGSPVLVGTGNGTMTSVTVFNGQTVTETITATCVTAATDGGVFHVSGSVSGSLGLATVGVSFVSDVISFTINDGATDFIVGDAFTVATTAANYV